MDINNRSFTSPKATIFMFWWWGAVTLFLGFLLYGTGLVSDDFALLLKHQEFTTVADILTPRGVHLNHPVFHFTHILAYSFVSFDNVLLIDILRIGYSVFFIYMVKQFFSCFVDQKSALLGAFLFFFYPNHDAVTFWYMSQHMSFSTSLLLYAYFLARNEHRKSAFWVALIGSFTCYGSPPVAFGLFILCCLEKEFKKGLLLLIPNIIFSIYYVVISKVVGLSGVSRLPSRVDLFSLGKQFILQVGGAVDSFVGPSFVLKLYYSIFENTFISVSFALLFTVCIIVQQKTLGSEAVRRPLNRKLVIALAVLGLSSMLMFAMTGKLPTIAFNLGNRTTFYTALLFAYLIIALPMPIFIRIVIVCIIVLSSTGNAMHWKQAYSTQLHIVDNMKKNTSLQLYDVERPIYVAGNQYSKMGPFSHIEILSESWATNSFLKFAGHENIDALPINKRFTFKSGQLVDRKYSLSYQVEKEIVVYDSELDKVMKISSSNINNYIAGLAEDKRHWIQMINNEYLEGLIVNLMPRLKYAF